MKTTTIFLIALLFTSCLFGQDIQKNISKNNEFGAQIGASTAIGLSYRHWFKKVGVQITALPVKTDNVTFFSAGVTGLFSFTDSKYIRVFGYLGNHFMYTENRKRDLFSTNQPTTYRSHYNIGFGPGFSFGSIVAFNLMVGYGFYDVQDTFNIYPTAEIGIYYKF